MIKQTTISTYSIALLVSAVLGLAASVPAGDWWAELARARPATAKYHDVTQAEADGYVPDTCHEGEGCHWFNWDYYLDGGVFDPERPEALIYRETRNGGWRLVAVEYIVPTDPDLPPPPAPEGFSGDQDDPYWRFFTEGYADWELTAWIWFYNPNGMFELENPRLEE
jgi:hypothetical protein